MFGILGLSALAYQACSQTHSQSKRIVIAVSTLFDGNGYVLRDTHIVLVGSKIIAIDAKAGPEDYDLRGLTVLPGWIDAHAHITWSFGPDGKNGGMDRTTPGAAYQSEANAYATLMAAFTTIQSPGSPTDIPLCDAIARGSIPGPRILTSAAPLFGRGEQTGTRKKSALLYENKKSQAPT